MSPVDDRALAATLDACIWRALEGPQASFAQWSDDGRAVRFDPEVSVFSAVDGFDAGGWRSLRDLVGGDFTVLVAPTMPPVPPEVRVTFSATLVQMVASADGAPAALVPDGLAVEDLGTDDLPAMLGLVELTSPGPFRSRTPELGRYVGVRQEGTLIAMAGERMRPPGAVEISAVCTHPDHQRRGLGAALTGIVAEAIRARDLVPFLHVVSENETARRLYRSLGFAERAELAIFGVRFP